MPFTPFSLDPTPAPRTLTWFLSPYQSAFLFLLLGSHLLHDSPFPLISCALMRHRWSTGVAHPLPVLVLWLHGEMVL
jgi:hypothetical protein